MKPRKVFLAIAAVSLVALYIDLPQKFPIRFAWGRYKIDRVVTRPNLELDFLGLRVKRILEIKEGLDLVGGTHLVYEAEMKEIDSKDRERALESVRSVIERRINLYGVSEPSIQTAKSVASYRVVVELPGVKNIDEALELIGKTAELEFREEETATKSGQIASDSARLYGPFQGKTGLSGKHLKRSGVVFNQNTGQPEVSLEFNDDGAKLFEEITQRNLNKQVAIFLDGQILSAPAVKSVINGGTAVIQGSFTVEQAKKLSIELNAGALPVPIKIVEQRNIGATLGAESVKKSFKAGLIGLGLVAVFMLANYGKKGFLANIALLIYTLVSLAVFKLIPITLTLSGIAGFILSIGMAVDANILIFERIREEIKWGKKKSAAAEAGFRRAWSSIRDSNSSTLITCGILYWFGTGSVRGFALTLAIGVLISLFSSITVTRTFIRLFDS